MAEVPFRVVTWNCHTATAASPLWEYLEHLDPDVALLQEVMGVPESIHERFACYSVHARGRFDSVMKFKTAMLVKGCIGPALPISSNVGWIREELAYWFGNLTAMEVFPDQGPPVKVVSVYSPAYAIDEHLARRPDADTGDVRLQQALRFWVADLLRASFEETPPDPKDAWIVAGDFNLSETFDGKRRPRGNREYLDRMASVGFVECLRQAQGKVTPTFRHATGYIHHQMDHLFVTPALGKHLRACGTGPQEEVFGPPRLSDHLPIIADFAWEADTPNSPV